MKENDLSTLLQKKFDAAQSYIRREIEASRQKAVKYYRGDPRGDEKVGRSKVISRDVAEAVDSALPSLIKVFTSGRTAVSVEPVGRDDEEFATAVEHTLDYVWNVQNNGYENYHTWFKTALYQKNGILKVYWATTTTPEREEYTGITEAELADLKTDSSREILETAEYGVIVEAHQPDPVTGILTLTHVEQKAYDVTVLYTPPPTGEVKTEPVAPEDFFIEPHAVSRRTARYFCHKTRKTFSELLEAGFDKATLNKIRDTEDTGSNESSIETDTRFDNEGGGTRLDDDEVSRLDPSLEEITIKEHYLKVDFDGDGIAEWRKVTTAGESYTILDNDYSDVGHPFFSITPNPEPFKFFGKDYYDDTKDVQDIKTTLERQALDNVYKTNNTRLVVDENTVNLDDVLLSAPGAPIRVSSNATTSVLPLQVSPILDASLAVIQYMDSVRENRTGITRFAQGLEPENVAKTLGGTQKILSAGLSRLELVAKNFAETGVRDAFYRIYELLLKHQDQPMTIRVAGKWVDVSPTEWREKDDVIINVVVASSQQDVEMNKLITFLSIDQQLAQLPAAADLLSPQNVYNKLAKLTEVAGYKTPELFYTNPATKPPEPPEQPPIDPMMQAAQMQIQIADAQSKHKMQIDEVELKHKIQLDNIKLQHEMQLEDMKAKAKAAQGLADKLMKNQPQMPMMSGNGQMGVM